MNNTKPMTIAELSQEFRTATRIPGMSRVTIDPLAITRMSCPLEDGTTQLAWGVVQAFATAGKARWMAQGRR